MNGVLTWSLALLAVLVGGWVYGGPGVALAATVIVFWLVLQFGRALRVLRIAGQAPMGQVPSAVMLQSRLKPGMTMAQLLTLTRSLGRRGAGDAETYTWADAGGATLLVEFEHGRCRAWQLVRPAEEPERTAPAQRPAKVDP